MRRLLFVIAGPNKGQRYPVTDTFTTLLGRSRHANTQLSDTSVQAKMVSRNWEYGWTGCLCRDPHFSG